MIRVPFENGNATHRQLHSVVRRRRSIRLSCLQIFEKIFARAAESPRIPFAPSTTSGIATDGTDFTAGVKRANGRPAVEMASSPAAKVLI